MAKADVGTSKLPQLMQTIPQELFDEIYKLPFTGDGSAQIDWGYKPPAVLKVDRESRAYYFANTTFHSTNRYLLKNWLSSLASADIACLREVQFNFTATQPASWFVFGNEEYPEVDDAVEAKEQRNQCRYWLKLVRDEAFGRDFRAPSLSFLTAQAWKVEDGAWKPGARYRFGDHPDDL